MNINIRGRLMDLSIPRVMGIINVTTDSFYSGSRYGSMEEVKRVAEKMLVEGADMIDIGGCSSRPGAQEVSEEEELRRVCESVSVVKRLAPEVIISVDTYRSSVAESAVTGSGADIINDISGGNIDKMMFPLIKKLKVPYIMMHMQGTPATMQNSPSYSDVVAEILSWFAPRISELQSEGVKDIIIDPGFGFGKTTEHNFEMLRRLDEFSVTGLPVLVGLSRKSMIWRTLDITPEEALTGTAALNMAALMHGASVIRAHDVKEAREVVTLFEKIYPHGVHFNHYY